MSSLGPAELWAMVIIPLDISSTTEIPKCSCFIVWIATLTLENFSIIYSLDKFFKISILSCIPSSLATLYILSTIFWSSSPRTVPIIKNLLSSGTFLSSRTFFQILSCIICSFSGLNCAKLTTRFFLPSFVYSYVP